MIDELSRLLAVNGFLPHGYCISWSPPLLMTYVISDIVIFLSYFSMPVAIVYFAQRRHDFPYRWLLWAFAAFIMTCGATHLMGAIILWQPLYWLDALLKAVTALISLVTAIVLWPLIPQALKLPSPAQLKKANEELQNEIVERKIAEAAARQAEFLKDQAMELARAGHWYIDFTEGADFYISSPRVAEIFGDPPREDLRYHIMDDWYVNIAAVDPAAAAATLANYQAAVEGRIARYDMVHPYRRPCDGNTVWVHVAGQVVRDASGQATRIYGVVMDVTASKLAESRIRTSEQELRRRSEQLQEANGALSASTEELARSNTELEQFAYVASHDLQEPLRMVVGFVQLLEKRLKDKLDDETREFMTYAIDGSLRMQKLIQDILAYSRVSTRGAPVEMLDCNAVVQESLVLLGSRIADTGTQVDISELPRLAADHTQLVQLFQNLIGNAIKFCKEGVPRVRIEAAKEGENWRFAVSDNGIGIADEYRERIFGIFQRLHTREEYEGTGIGLAICKRIVQRHGGEIGVMPAADGGSTFWFTLPAGGIP